MTDDELKGIKMALAYLIKKEMGHDILTVRTGYVGSKWRSIEDRDATIERESKLISEKYKPILDALGVREE
jgi:hypothetical protein